ncbi:MAG: L-histidine N(alpha)-methyltransferase, partial [Afipia sp.]|nr:L-histidine N(alpha)-methyltransferase [Afipia sp.]
MNAHVNVRTETRPEHEDRSFARDVIAGLSQQPKRLPPKYFYDEAGSKLFEQITLLPEYYPTRTELRI